jgi:hypothetical protein
LRTCGREKKALFSFLRQGDPHQRPNKRVSQRFMEDQKQYPQKMGSNLAFRAQRSEKQIWQLSEREKGRNMLVHNFSTWET